MSVIEQITYYSDIIADNFRIIFTNSVNALGIFLPAPEYFLI